ncbi:hypothetical protein IWQ62_001970 [Dispira parvispora]|uniref:CID domain-containing protein n=1 Tax=Dispira parvispora TaxID=1520584 RepID=A0A9W8AXT7_9FUNG|nr:hypothetical protein IWQ62_001970 [Dispira parvispora]
MDYEDDVDPFEARLTFVSMLSKITASLQSTHKPSHFAMKHVSLHEDLYQCILEQLDSVNVTSRMNLLGIIDAICTLSAKSNYSGYLKLIERDLPLIFTKVAPPGKEGDVNVASAKQILESWRRRGIFRDSTNLQKVLTSFADRDVQATSEATDSAEMRNSEILKRMEEDRERHKRTKEDIWGRLPNESEEAEFESAWKTTSDLNEQDVDIIRGENRRYIPDYPWNEDFSPYLPT